MTDTVNPDGTLNRVAVRRLVERHDMEITDEALDVMEDHMVGFIHGFMAREAKQS